MALSTTGTLVLIGIVAVVSPILAELTRQLAVPDIMFEIVLDAPGRVRVRARVPGTSRRGGSRA